MLSTLYSCSATTRRSEIKIKTGQGKRLELFREGLRYLGTYMRSDLIIGDSPHIPYLIHHILTRVERVGLKRLFI